MYGTCTRLYLCASPTNIWLRFRSALKERARWERSSTALSSPGSVGISWAAEPDGRFVEQSGVLELLEVRVRAGSRPRTAKGTPAARHSHKARQASGCAARRGSGPRRARRHQVADDLPPKHFGDITPCVRLKMHRFHQHADVVLAVVD
jgi:hypothetical protein